MKVLPVIFLLELLLLFANAAEPEYNIFCYWDGQSINRKHRSNFQSWDVNTKLCTHLIYGSSLGLDPAGSGEVKLNRPEEDLDYDQLAQVRRLRNIQLKTIISIGGWKDESKLISKMLSDSKKRDQFYSSLINLLYKTAMQGVQINWKFPAHLGSQPEDQKNFVTFLHELRIILQEHNFLLMVVVSARLDEATLAAYDIPKITKYADFVTLLVHDHQDPYSRRLSYNAPLSGDKIRSVESCVSHWVEHSNSPSKLLLAVPLFAQSYTMDSSNTVVGSPSKGPGRQQQDSLRPGYMTYGEFCKQVSRWEKKFDNIAQVPYAYKGDQWVSYENGRSISAKMHLVKEQRLGGAQVMSLDADDFQGDCGERYSLLRVIVSIIGNPDTLTTQKPTTEGIGLCPQEGLFRNIWDCQQYYECRDAKRIDYECIEGYYFDEKLGECQPASQVECKQDFVTWRPGQKRYSFENLPLNLKIVY
ncbi:chitinase-like protein 3 [Drosophila innubila]|uniref:chitinase-like protein 3 n=1 Tax=Drosophila innubila TaxID=198719 RepID=UPI00148E20D4|nr:chitinase-like protein 3 [Drosophila innubila]